MLKNNIVRPSPLNLLLRLLVFQTLKSNVELVNELKQVQ